MPTSKPPRPRRWAGLHLGPCLIALGLALALMLMTRPDTNFDSTTGAKILLGPVQLSNGFVQFERLTDDVTALPRLRVVTRWSRGLTDDDLVVALSLFSKVLAQRRHFSVTWDVRGVSFPRISMKQHQVAREWIGDHVVAWDTYVQAHCVIITNPLLRGLLSLIIRVFQPPQPLTTARDNSEALAFARGCCKHPRSFVKKSYADGAERQKKLLAWL